MRRKKSLSLLEILLSVSLLSVSLGGVGFQIHKILKQDRFEKSASLILEKILFAKECSANFGTDITLLLSQKKEGLSCVMTSSSPLMNQEKWLLAQDKFFDTISSFSLNGENRERLKIQITNGGRIEKRGILQLNMKDKSVDIVLSQKPKRVSKLS
ncbi:MAG: hypothetical protein P4L16_03410 [Chlamydiales bacterium]|nr:hypothetical protein [Chlamydiales bacterium]